MAEEKVLQAEERKVVGKKNVHAVRDEGLIPGVIYGPEMKENVNVQLPYRDFLKLFDEYGKHHIFNLQVAKKKHKVFVKDYKIHPISRKFLHVDFYAVSDDKPFITEIPLNYIGVPVGVKEGGARFTFIKKLRIRTTVDKLPDKIDVDISHLRRKQYMIVRQIKQPEDFKILTHEGNVLVEIK